MIISEEKRREIYEYLIKEGVCYAKKDFNLAKRPRFGDLGGEKSEAPPHYQGSGRGAGGYSAAAPSGSELSKL